MLTHIKYHIGNYLPALRSRNYRLYFFGQGISLIGSWMAAVAEQWLIYPTLTNNQSLLGVASMINLLPTTFLVLFAGVLADRVDKKKSMILIQALFGIISLILALLVYTKTVQLWQVFVATFLGGVIFAFDMPVRNALMLNLVEKKDYPSALSLNTGIFNIARAVGPAVAGFTIAVVGIALAYFLNSLSFLVVIGSLLLMRLPKHIPQSSKQRVSVVKGLGEAFTYVSENKVIGLILLLVAAVGFLTWPANTLLPVFAHDIYNVGEIGFGFMVSCFGLGAVVGAFGFSKLFHAIKNKYGLLLLTLNLTIFSALSFALVPSYYLSLLFLVLGGWAVGTFVSFASSIVQLYSPDQLRGRMASLYSFVLVGTMPFGALYASYCVTRLGPRYTVAVSIACLAVICFTVFLLFGKKLKKKLNELTDAS